MVRSVNPMAKTSPAVYILFEEVMEGGTEMVLNNDPALVMMRSSEVSMVPKIGNVIEAMGPPCGQPATKVTSLFGLHAKSGQLVWTSNSIDTNNDEEKEEKYPLQQHQIVLQREDFFVQQISTTTGKELWNATLGHFSALAFDDLEVTATAATAAAVGIIPTLQKQFTHPYKPGTKETMPLLDSHELQLMPSIMFDEIGQTLTVIHQTKILWRQTLHSFIASVYGISHGQWVPLTVQEEEGLLTEHQHLQQQSQLEQLQINNFHPQLPPKALCLTFTHFQTILLSSSSTPRSKLMA